LHRTGFLLDSTALTGSLPHMGGSRGLSPLIINPDPAFVIPDEDGTWGVGLQAGGSFPNQPTQPESGT
jgi:hypothetical protein